MILSSIWRTFDQSFFILHAIVLLMVWNLISYWEEWLKHVLINYRNSIPAMSLFFYFISFLFQLSICHWHHDVGIILNNIIWIKDQNFSTTQNFEPCSYYSRIIFKSNRIGLSCSYVGLYNERPHCIYLW